MLMMKAAIRVLVIALAVALGAVPLVLDGCLMTCQPATRGLVSTHSATEHSCHHASHSGPLHQLQTETTSCSHDHSQMGSVVASGGDSHRSLKPAHAPISVVVAFVSMPVTHAAAVESPPRMPLARSQPASSLALPLRI